MVTDGPHGLRKQPDGGDHVGHRRQPARHLLPDRVRARLVVGPGARAPGRRGARRGGARAGRRRCCSGPGINIKRSPLCGRNFEYFSEDPLVAGVLGRRARRGASRARASAPRVKHFAANNQETDRLRVSAPTSTSARCARSTCPAFERVVTQRAAVDGDVRLQQGQRHVRVRAPLAAHRGAARRVGLRRPRRVRLGRGRRPRRRPRRRARPRDAAQPGRQRRRDRRRRRATATLDEAVLDTAVARVLQLVERSRRRSDVPTDTASTPTPTTRWPARPRRQCAVLLKNDGRLLPLRPAGRAARRGDRRVRPHAALPGRRQLAGQPDPGRRRRSTSCAPRVPDDVRSPSPPASGSATAERRRGARRRGRARSRRGADVVVVFLGLPAADESEGFDRTHIDLPANQTAPAGARSADANPRVVVVLANGSAVRAVDLGATTPAPCSRAGWAARPAAARSPTCCSAPPNPSGRLAETHPAAAGGHPVVPQLPRRGRPRPLRRGRVRRLPRVRRRATATSATRSGTACPTRRSPTPTWTSRAGDVDARRPGRQVTCRSPTPARVAGEEVVAGLRRRPRGLRRPARRASSRASPRSTSAPGERRRSAFDLDARDLSYWSTAARGWVVEGGEFAIDVGASSRDLRLSRHRRRPRPPLRVTARRHVHPAGVARRPRPAPRCFATLSGPTRPAGRAASSATTS